MKKKRKNRTMRRSFPGRKQSYKTKPSAKPNSVNAAAYRSAGERALTV